MSDPSEDDYSQPTRELARDRVSEAIQVLRRSEVGESAGTITAAGREGQAEELVQTAVARLSDASELLDGGDDDEAVLELLESADTLIEAVQDSIVTWSGDFESANSLGEVRELIDQAAGLVRIARRVRGA